MGKRNAEVKADAAMLKAVRLNQKMRVKKEKEMIKKLPILGVSLKDAASSEGRMAISKAFVRQKKAVHREVRVKTRPIRRVKKGFKMVRFGIRRYEQFVDFVYAIYQILKAVLKK